MFFFFFSRFLFHLYVSFCKRLPAGKRLHNYGKSTSLLWVNTLKMGHFQVRNLGRIPMGPPRWQREGLEVPEARSEGQLGGATSGMWETRYRGCTGGKLKGTPSAISK